MNIKSVNLLGKEHRIEFVDELIVDSIEYYSYGYKERFKILTHRNKIDISDRKIILNILFAAFQELSMSMGLNQFNIYNKVNEKLLFNYISQSYLYLLLNNDIEDIINLNSVDLFGDDIEIKYVNSFENKMGTDHIPENSQGFCFYDISKILILDSNHNKKDVYRTTFWHEITHSIFNFVGYEIENEETFIHMVSFILRSFTNENKDFLSKVRYYLGGDK